MTDRDSGGAVTLAPGDRLRVELEEAGASGYSWETRKEPDGSVLKLVKERRKSPKCKNDPCPVGGPNTYIAIFKATGAGDTRISLVQRRSFEPKRKNIGSFKLDVTVE